MRCWLCPISFGASDFPDLPPLPNSLVPMPYHCIAFSSLDFSKLTSFQLGNLLLVIVNELHLPLAIVNELWRRKF